VNNGHDNIVFLCQKCHKAWHYGAGVLTVFSDRIVSIEPAGEVRTFDIEMDGEPHNFVANGLVVHNSMESTRFCNYGQEKHGGIRVIPMLDGLNEYQLTRRQNLYAHIEQVYLAELAEGIKPQQARDVLPLSLKTEYAWSANFRNWRHIFRVRLARAAHPQLRVVMRMAFEILHGVAPTVFPTEEFLKEEA